MEQFISQLAEKAGISNDQAKTAVDFVLGSLKNKLPEGIANQLGGVLGGKDFSLSSVAMDKLDDVKDDAMDKLKDLKDSAKGLIDKIF